MTAIALLACNRGHEVADLKEGARIDVPFHAMDFENWRHGPIAIGGKVQCPKCGAPLHLRTLPTHTTAQSSAIH